MNRKLALKNQLSIRAPGDDALDDTALRALVGYQLKRADLAMQQNFSRRVGEPFALRQVEFSVLVLLSANDNVKHKQISAALGVAPPNMVAVMSALETRQLITRRQNPADGRSSFWQLTDAGVELERAAMAAVHEMEASHVAELGALGRSELAVALYHLWSGDEASVSGY